MSHGSREKRPRSWSEFFEEGSWRAAAFRDSPLSFEENLRRSSQNGFCLFAWKIEQTPSECDAYFASCFSFLRLCPHPWQKRTDRINLGMSRVRTCYFENAEGDHPLRSCLRICRWIWKSIPDNDGNDDLPNNPARLHPVIWFHSVRCTLVSDQTWRCQVDDACNWDFPRLLKIVCPRRISSLISPTTLQGSLARGNPARSRIASQMAIFLSRGIPRDSPVACWSSIDSRAIRKQSYCLSFHARLLLRLA